MAKKNKLNKKILGSVSAPAFAVVSPLLAEGETCCARGAAETLGGLLPVAKSPDDLIAHTADVSCASDRRLVRRKRPVAVISRRSGDPEDWSATNDGIRSALRSKKRRATRTGATASQAADHGLDVAGCIPRQHLSCQEEKKRTTGGRLALAARPRRDGARTSQDDHAGSDTDAAARSKGPQARKHTHGVRRTILPYEKVFDMNGVQRARFCHSRKNPEETYLPVEDALGHLAYGTPPDDRLDLRGWGIRDTDMPVLAKVALERTNPDGEQNGVRTLLLDNCWRLSDRGIEDLTKALLGHPCLQGLERCSLAGCSLLTDESAFHIHRAFGGLTSIDVSGTGITDNGLQLVLGVSKTLCSLGLRDLEGMTDRGLGAILQCIKRRRSLRSLQLCRSLRFTDNGLLSLLSAGGLLESLDIRGCSQLSELCLMGLNREAFASTQLRVLDVRGMAIADIGLGWVAQGCKVLEQLNVSRCPLLTDLGLDYLGKGSGVNAPTPLQVLNLAGLAGITDEGMAGLVARCGPSIEDLTLDGALRLGDDTVMSIARSCPALTSLSMVELTRTSDASLKQLGRRCERLRLLDSSSDINILETSHRTRVPKLGTHGIREMVTGTRRLAVLRLNGACKISDEALSAVGMHCNALEELCIRSCSLITDDGLAAVARGCSRLRHLDLGGCVRLTDASVCVVAIRAGAGLRVLDVTGCRGVTDASLVTLSEHCRQLQSLTLQGCEQVTDHGMAALLRRCRSLIALNLRGVPELTAESITAIETNCRRLRSLNMEGIPQITGSRVQVAGNRLPFVVRKPGTRQLRPCHFSCQVFNAFVQERAEWTAAAITVQKVVRGALCRLRWERGEQRKAWATMTLRRDLSSVMATRLFRKRLAQRRAEHLAARIIQSRACDVFRVRAARGELQRRRKERFAAINVQRLVRGRQGRRAAISRRHMRQRAQENWGWIVKRLHRQQHALASFIEANCYSHERTVVFSEPFMPPLPGNVIDRYWRETLSVTRCYQQLWRIARRFRRLQACRRVQRAWRNLLGRRARQREEREEQERRVVAAAIIERSWRSYYRTKWLMRDIRLSEQAHKRQRFVQEYAQIELASWWCRVRVKHLKRTVLQELIVARRAAAAIKRAYRSYMVRTLTLRAKKNAIMMRCRWRRFYLGIMRLPRPEDAIKIQRATRRFLRRRKRRVAATTIQRVYRGALARRLYVVKLARMYTLNAVIIQRIGRGHIARRGKVRAALEANHAARTITRAIRTFTINQAFRKMVRDVRSRRARFERAQREALVRHRAEAALRRALLMNQQKAARAIQARWRQRQARKQQAEAEVLKIEMDRRLALDKKLRQKRIDELRKKQKGTRVGGALSALGRKLNKLTAQADPETSDRMDIDDQEEGEESKAYTRQELRRLREKEREEKEKQEADVLANSILNHQTNSTRQVGICGVHITVGSKEHQAFSEAQDYYRATKEDYMKRVSGDLSGKKEQSVHLWIKMGQGDGVVTEVRLQAAPTVRANSAVAKVRQKEADQASHLLVGHNRCKLELMCKVLSRTAGIAPAVDDIVLCPRKADEATLLEKGYERLLPQLKTFDLGKGFLFIHRKTFKTRPKKLDVAKYRLKRNDWFTRRSALLLEKYALTEDEVVELYRIFARTDFKGNATMDVYSFFSEIGEVESRYGHWVLRAVGAGGSNTDITWDQYLEVVCFFSMFSRHEVLRFVFGTLDPSMRGYLDEHDFQNFVTAVTQHESGIPGNFVSKAKRGYERLARSSTQLDFPQFDKLCAQFPRLPHPVYRLQTAIQKHNMGESFWDAKKQMFAGGRDAVGVEKHA